MSKLDVSPETHDRFKVWCKERGAKMKDVLEGLLTELMTEGEKTALKKKLLPPLVKQAGSADAWSRPPFWASGPNKDQVRRDRHEELGRLRCQLVEVPHDTRTYNELQVRVNELERELGLTPTSGAGPGYDYLAGLDSNDGENDE